MCSVLSFIRRQCCHLVTYVTTTSHEHLTHWGLTFFLARHLTTRVAHVRYNEIAGNKQCFIQSLICRFYATHAVVASWRLWTVYQTANNRKDIYLSAIFCIQIIGYSFLRLLTDRTLLQWTLLPLLLKVFYKLVKCTLFNARFWRFHCANFLLWAAISAFIALLPLHLSISLSDKLKM